MNELRTKNILRYVSMFGLIICAILAVWAWQRGILTSQQAMSDFVQKAGFWGPALFLILQAVQVVIPILHQLLSGCTDFGLLAGVSF